METKDFLDKIWPYVRSIAIGIFMAGIVAWGSLFLVLYALYKGWIPWMR